MPSAKEKRIVSRLEDIKFRAAELNAGTGSEVANLAEEAAGLGLELHAILTAKKEK